MVNATLCAILGPGLALRGPDGSMHTAVNGMMTHYKFTLMCFATGLICFMRADKLCRSAKAQHRRGDQPSTRPSTDRRGRSRLSELQLRAQLSL